MGRLLNQMEKVAYFAEEAMMEKLALEAPQDSNNTNSTARGMIGALGVGAAGGLAATLPSQFETLRNNALMPAREARAGLTHTRGSEARRFLAQEKSMLRNAHKAMKAGDTARATKLTQQLNSPTHRAWRGFKSMRLPGKFKLLAPILGTAAGAIGLGAAGLSDINKAVSG